MHPKALLEACADLVGLVLKFDHPADQVVSRFFRDHREFGPRERATLAETVYTVLRKKLLFDHLSPSGSGPKERRMAILGFHGPRDFLKSALNDTEKRWLDNCDAVEPDDLLERHRHNLPEWLVAPLKAQLGDEFWPLVESLQQPAPLDLRVNALTDKRAGRAEGAGAGRHQGVAHAVLALGPADRRQAGADQARRLRPRRGRGAGRRLAIAGPAARRQARRDGGRFLRRRRRQDAGASAPRCATPAGSTPSTPRPTGWTRSSRGWRAASCRTCIRPRSPTSATSASSGWPARSTACWSMRRARDWARCGAIRTSSGGSRPSRSRS